MKSFTNISQSKILAEILPLESADMHYNNVSIRDINYVDEHRADLMEYNRAIKVLSKYTMNPLFEVIPCWSIGALLELMPDEIVIDEDESYCLNIKKEGFQYYMFYDSTYSGDIVFETDITDSLTDACYEMILKLKEENLL